MKQGPDSFNNIDAGQSPEKMLGSEYLFYFKTKEGEIKQVPFLGCRAFDFQGAYNSYVGWCQDNNEEPLPLEDLIINTFGGDNNEEQKAA